MYRTQILQRQCLCSKLGPTKADTLSSQEIIHSDFIGLGLRLASSDLEENGD